MRHRAEIDGLRAIAVLPVILFHAGFAAFDGGFVGVDVFFVISGYLITSLIVEELESGRFSLARFYERRARRILPALLLVVLCCLPFAWAWLLPDDMQDFSESLLAVAGFSSNFLFWRETGYFATASELKPLLHTWSLAVEEQYYVLFPLWILLVWRLGRKWVVGSLVAVTVLSFAVALWATARHPAAGFFLLPSRGWEILVGALVALAMRTKRTPALGDRLRQVIAEAGALAGILLILGSVFVLQRDAPFPGVNALAPTLGTALLILFALPTTVIGRCLGTAPLVRIGLVSYSAYLWHQPLFAFARHRSLHELPFHILLALSALSVVLAFVSWRYVEMPFRDRRVVSRKQVGVMAVGGSLVMAALGGAGMLTRGESFVSPALAERQRGIEALLLPNFGLSPVCDGSFTLSAECRTADSPEVLLWGDSHAMHLAQGFLASKPDLRLVQLTMSVCGPILGVAPVTAEYPESWARECLEANEKVFTWLRSQRSVRYVVLGSHFGQYVGARSRVLLADGAVVPGREVAETHLRRTLERLKELGVEPVVFAPTPRSGEDTGRCLARAVLLSRPLTACDFDEGFSAERQKPVWDLMTSIDEHYRVVWLREGICAGGRCAGSIGDTPLFRDGAHLTAEGSAQLGSRMGFWNLVTGSSSSAPAGAGTL